MINPDKINKILVIRSDRFGEFLLNIPAIRALKETFPKAKIILAVSRVVSELACLVECADEVVVWSQIKQNLRRHKFDLSICFNPDKEANIKCFLAGIPVRIGYNRKCGFLLTGKIQDTKQLGNRHEVECNLELVNLVGADTKNRSLSLNIGRVNFPEFTRKKIVAIHPFTSDPVKQWPAERFRILAQRIKNELQMEVVIVGLSLGESKTGSYGVDMTNRTTLVELAGLLKRCSLLISGDSGPVHLACSVDIPVIALFRNDLPGKTARRWGPWSKNGTVIEKPDLSEITVDEVFEKVKEVIAK